MNYLNLLKKYQYINKNNKELVLFTVIFGNYDSLKDIEYFENNVEYICFTDQNIKHDKWKIIYVNTNGLDKVLLARIFKFNPNILFRQYKKSIFIDGSIKLKKKISDFEKDLVSRNDIVFFEHPRWNCIYKEIKACNILKKEDKYKLEKIKNFYNKIKYPKNNGLIATGVIFRNHNNNKIEEAMDKITSLLIEFTIRDQLIVNYVLWLNKIKYNQIKLNIFNNDYFKIYNHYNNNINFMIRIKYIFFNLLSKIK